MARRWLHRNDPEDPANLARITPKRCYSREEVDRIMAELAGLINDGLPMDAYLVTERARWFEVEVTYEDRFDPSAEITYETWYFFKEEAR